LLNSKLKAKTPTALKTFAVCRTENVLHKAGISTLGKIKGQDTARIAIRVITNESHPIRSYFMSNKIHDEYATKPRKIKPIFIRAIEYLGQLHINVRRIETSSYYLRPPWKKNRYEQIDLSLCAIPKGSSSIRFRAETAKKLKEKYNEHINIYTDGSKKDEKIGCVVITPDQKFRKRLKP
jgi:hypothetical protein